MARRRTFHPSLAYQTDWQSGTITIFCFPEGRRKNFAGWSKRMKKGTSKKKEGGFFVCRTREYRKFDAFRKGPASNEAFDPAIPTQISLGLRRTVVALMTRSDEQGRGNRWAIRKGSIR